MDLIAQRLCNQRLWRTELTGAVDVVHTLVAMQSQELALAKWSVGQRAIGVDQRAVDRALSDGGIVRTHVLRPTWHFVAAKDLRWLLAVSAPRVQQLNAYMYRQVDLDGRTLARLTKRVEGSLRGEHLTREALSSILDAEGMRLAYIMMFAELEGLVCSGIPAGRQETYALVEERIPPGPACGRDAALAELTRRFFTTRGPATIKDFTRWASLTVTMARAGIEANATLATVTLDGVEYFHAENAESTRAQRPTAPHVDLLQGYDESIASYPDSRGLFAPSSDRKVEAFTHAVFVDGRLCGHFRRRKGVLEISLYRELTKSELAALDTEVARYSSFLNAPVSYAFV